jgi:hypothetical protein
LNLSYLSDIVSLPRLKSLNFNCRVAKDAISTLSRCRGLKHLALRHGSFDLNKLLPTIGRKLASLEYTSSTPFLETVEAIVEHCPNLQMLDLGCEEFAAETKAAAVDLIKGGLNKLSKLKMFKKLSKLKVDVMTVRLGTEWEGYL